MDEKPSFTEQDIQKAKKAQLRDMCETCDLDSSGTKADLQDRLLDHISEGEPEEEKIEEEAPEEEELEEEEEPEKEEAPPEEEEVEEEIPEEEEAVEEPPEEEEEPEEEPEKEEVPVTPEEKPPEKEVEHPCPTCGKELSYIDTYDRWYRCN